MNLYELPHTTMYDRDLGFLIREYKDLICKYKESILEYQKLSDQYADLDKKYVILTKIYEDINANIVDTATKITREQLKEWLDNGTLLALLEGALPTTLTFDTTADMLKANLQPGSKVSTYGYAALHDGGACDFYIVGSETDISDKLYITLENTNKAVLFSNSVNDLQLGITEVMDLADYYGMFLWYDDITIYKDHQISADSTIINESYNAPSGIVITSNKHVKFYGKLTVKPNAARTYNVVYVHGDNIIIDGLHILGERDSHTQSNPDSTDEWGYNMYVVNSDNITINDYKGENPHGDNLVLFNVDHCIINNLVSNKAFRNGISILGGVTNVLFNNTSIYATSGTSPEGAIDIEPNETESAIDNITFNNLYIDQTNINGLVMYLGNDTSGYIPDVYVANSNLKAKKYALVHNPYTDINLNVSNSNVDSMIMSAFCNSILNFTGITSNKISFLEGELVAERDLNAYITFNGLVLHNGVIINKTEDYKYTPADRDHITFKDITGSYTVDRSLNGLPIELETNKVLIAEQQTIDIRSNTAVKTIITTAEKHELNIYELFQTNAVVDVLNASSTVDIWSSASYKYNGPKHLEPGQNMQLIFMYDTIYAYVK